MAREQLSRTSRGQVEYRLEVEECVNGENGLRWERSRLKN